MAILTLIEAIPIKCFVSHRPTDPFFGTVKKKKKNYRITCKEASTLIYKHTILSLILTPIVLNYHRYFVFVAFLDI